MPLLGQTMEGRNAVFQKLKPPCVALSQATLALHGPKGNLQAVTDNLTKLNDIVHTVVRGNSLDAKIADYVFFPLSQVLKLSQKVSIRSLELTFSILRILIDQGWTQHLQPQLATQIVILCTIMAGNKPPNLAFTETTDELQAQSLWCLYNVFEYSQSNKEAKTLLLADTNVPQLGQTISTILERIESGGDVEVQTAATHALEALGTFMNGHKQIAPGFLPGIVSKLTKILTPSTKLRRSHRVLTGCLFVLNNLLQATVSDEVNFARVSEGAAISNGTKAVTTPSVDATWLETAATQLKSALTSILRLRTHSRDDVEDGVARLCYMLLVHCRKSLSNCSYMALETLIFLATRRPEIMWKTRIQWAMRNDPSLVDLQQSMLHDWLQSLPTTMQGADEEVKIKRLQKIDVARSLLVDCEVDTSLLDRAVATALRDSVTVTLQIPTTKHQRVAPVEPVQSLDLAVLEKDRASLEFGSALVQYRGQEETLATIEMVTRNMSKSTGTVSTFVADLARFLHQSHGEGQIASFWLLLTATQTALHKRDDVDEFLTMGDDSPAAYTETLGELYSFALSVLTDSSDEPTDSRLQSLSLRVLALRAQLAGEEFRYELIDALYPVLHTLATPDKRLQHDSITTLNIFTQACNYSSVKDLIIQNVDYLTNAVALKLNAFDVSPQAPQVLLMMVRLTGPSLLPYLEDTVESIFAALEDYHGYPLLVELLFRVLSVIAEEGAKAPQLAITESVGSKMVGLRVERWQPTTITDLADLLRGRKEDEKTEVAVRRQDETETHPEQPWKKVRALDESEEPDEEDQDEEALTQQDQRPDDEEPPPPAPKTYNLLLKITELTQHFLPSASPSLRASLLALIKSTVPAIATHENSFLPLINTLWPEIVSRLDDSEAHVQATALDIIAVLCEHAGDFMRTRIEHLWPSFIDLHNAVTRDIVQIERPANSSRSAAKPTSAAFVPSQGSLESAVARMQASPADYSNTSTRLLWDALVALLTVVVQHVPLTPEMFHEALGILTPVLRQPQVREALEVVNADAVWLASLETGAVDRPTAPTISGLICRRFAALPG